MKKTYNVTILDQNLTLKTEKDESHVKRVADQVNKVFFEIQQNADRKSMLKIAILGALNLADEIVQQEQAHKEQVRDWKDEIGQILEALK